MITPICVFLDNGIIETTGKHEVSINQLNGDFQGMKNE